MPNPEYHPDAILRNAMETYREWLRRQMAGAGGDFERLCAGHPEAASALRQLHSLFQLAQAAAGSATFHHSLREVFGEEAEVTLALDDVEPAAEIMETAVLDASAGRTAEFAAEVETPGRYALKGEVARGGMGIIYKVRDRELNRTLAMKVMLNAPSLAHRMGKGPPAVATAQAGGRRPGDGLPAGAPTSHPLLSRFLEEVQVTAQLDHPGIVAVHELGLDAAGRPYFTMKLVKGRDLSRIFELARADQEDWNLPRAVGALIKACQAVAFAHTKGVIHRDLKPANIMVGRFGEVYVMDWGLAKVTGRKDLHDLRLAPASPVTVTQIQTPRATGGSSAADSPLITMDGSVVGTPAYMPPEQAQGQVEQVDAVSDVYSLGTILYNLLTGQAPYVEPGARLSPHTILARVLDGPPKRIHTLNPQAPPELIAICEKAMTREKRGRYQSSLDLAEDLQAWLDHRVVKAYRTGAVAEFKSWIARNRLAALTGAAAVVVVVAFLLFDSMRERANALRLKHNLAQQYLRRGHAFCESGEVTRGLHWFAKAMDGAPQKSSSLRAVIRENLTAWSRNFNPPAAILHHDIYLDKTAFSPDGTRIATATHVGTVQLWSPATGEPLGEPLLHEGFIRTLIFSPDGKIVLTSSGNRIARLWSAETGASLKSLMDYGGGQAAFSPDGKRVLAPSSDNTARVWSVETGEPIGEPLRHEGGIHAVAFSADGTRALTGSNDKTARLWSLNGASRVRFVMRHEEPVYDVMFNSDGRLVITLTEQTVHFWSVETGLRVGSPLQHGSNIDALALSPDGKRVVTGGDKTARLWSVETRQQVGALMWHEGTVLAVAFARDGKSIVTGSSDKTARHWSGETGEPLSPPMLHANVVNQVAISPDGTLVLTREYGQTAVLWSIRPARVSALTLEASPVFSVAFSPDGKRLAGGGSSSTGAQMWTVDTGQRVGALINYRDKVWAVTFSPDGKSLLTGSRDKTARLWSVETGKPLGPQFVHKSEVRTVAFSPDGKLAATGSFDKTARVWSTETGQPVGPSLEHPLIVEEVAFSPDGKNLLTACSDGAARLWSIQTGKPVLPPLWHRGTVLAAAFSPDGNQIVTGGRDNLVRFWDSRSGRPTGLVLEHPDWVEDLCFTADGRRLWTLGLGARLWDVDTGERIGPALPGQGYDIALSPDGTRLAIAGEQSSKVRLLAPSVSAGDLKDAALWVQVLTWTEMDDHGALTWLDAATRRARSAQLQKLGGAKMP